MRSSEASEYRWAAFAWTGVALMFITGIFRLVSGIIGLFNNEWVVRGYSGYYFVDISGLAWWWIIVGALLILAGFAILSGRTWGRVLGIIFVGLSAVSELFWIPVYPLWSILMIVMYVLILYSLFVVREPLR
jgi:hypothetical protein